jgi:DNA-directed RNA polymerase specialized sigma subunit
MENSLRQDLLYSGDVLSDYSMPGAYDDERRRDVIDFIYYELDPQEKTVYEYLTGKYGKPKKTAGEIASIMGVSDATVSRIRKRIEKKVAGYLG